RVKNVVQRQRQFHRAQVGTEVATGARHAFEQEFAQYVGQGRQLRAREAAHVARRFERGQQRTHGQWGSGQGDGPCARAQYARRPTQSASACRVEVSARWLWSSAAWASSSTRSA